MTDMKAREPAGKHVASTATFGPHPAISEVVVPHTLKPTSPMANFALLRQSLCDMARVSEPHCNEGA